jgi:transaldolase
MMISRIELRHVRLFQDGASVEEMRSAAAESLIAGFTTNPTLMAKAGICNYEQFARAALRAVSGKPISFEVFADDFPDMARQARIIKSWGENVYVKIPVMNTSGEQSYRLIAELSAEGIPLNVTAVFSEAQIEATSAALAPGVPAIISVFAGRIADSGKDPVPLMTRAARLTRSRPGQQLLWASPRELLNIIQADECGCDIITATPDIIKKLSGVGKDLEQFSRETVKMFYDDARLAGFSI